MPPEEAPRPDPPVAGPRAALGPWAWMRLVWRMPVYALGTALLSLAWFLTWPLSAFSRGLRRRMRHLTMVGWGRWTLWCFSIRVARTGALPRGGTLLVANHVSYVDIALLASCGDVVFVSMRELLNWPFFGQMAHSLGTVFLDRERKREIVLANREMARWIALGHTVVLFPEGENSHGERVQRFRPALLEPAATAELPVAAATIGYVTPPGDAPASSTVAWVREPFLPHVLRLTTRRWIEARIVFHAELEHSSDRKALAQRLHARVSSAFVPLTPP